MAPAMKAALDAGHELMELDSEDSDFDRVVSLGLVSQVLGSLCPAQAKVLHDIIYEHFVGEHDAADEDATERI